MPLLDHHVGRAVLRHAEEQVERQLGAVVEHRDAARGVDRVDAAAGDERDVALGERRAAARRRRPATGGTGAPSGITNVISAGVAHAALGQLVVQQQRALARRRRALERRAADADDRVALGERRDHLGAAARRPPRSRTRCRPRRGPAWRPCRSRRRARRRGRRPRGRRASVVTRRASGSIAVIVSCRKRTPGLAMSRYCRRTASGVVAPEHHVELRVSRRRTRRSCRSASRRPRRRAPPTASC